MFITFKITEHTFNLHEYNCRSLTQAQSIIKENNCNILYAQSLQTLKYITAVPNKGQNLSVFSFYKHFVK